jgi:hypothetical protein
MYLAYLGNNKIKEENIMSFIIIVSVIIYFKFLEGMIKDKEIRFIINCCFIWVLMIIVASFCSLNSNCITPIINDYNSGKIIKQENIVIEGTDTTTIVKYKYN